MTAHDPTHVLGVDQATVSGWAIALVGGKVLESGLAKDHCMRAWAVQRAMRLVDNRAENLLFVFEDHSDIPLSNGARFNHKNKQAPRRNAASLIGMGRALGRWEELLDAKLHPERLRLGVTSEDWRGRVLGCRNALGTDELKQRAVRWAHGHMGNLNIADHNEAEAVCIAAWGALDGVSVLDRVREVRRVKARVKRVRAKQVPLFGGRDEG